MESCDDRAAFGYAYVILQLLRQAGGPVNFYDVRDGQGEGLGYGVGPFHIACPNL